MPIPALPLNDGHSLPAIGLGTYGMRGERGIESVASGLRAGYRLLDTALRYRNEAEVGEGMRRSGVDRAEICVTSKVRGRHHGFRGTLAGFELSRANLGVESIDLYLIHWPLPRLNRFVDSWRAMIQLQRDGLVRSIGVSNFTPAHISRLIDETGVAPAVNQIELHPHFPQGAQRDFHAAHNIVTQSWSPLGRGRRLRSDPTVTDIATSHGVTPTQVVLRWHTQLGAVPIPKSANPARQAENLDVFSFALTPGEVSAISGLARGGRLWAGHPDWHYEF